MHISRIKLRHFTRDRLLGLLLLSAVVIGSVVFFSFCAHDDIAQKYIDNAATNAVSQFEAMDEPMTQS